jgi:GntR family transcriptional regulator, rspAB operon transcriptional repressor
MTYGTAVPTIPREPTRQAAAQVFERLRERIVSLDLAPGTVLDRAGLQQDFGFSSTPIRDALLRLGEEGLVDIYPQSATRVSLIDVAQARQAQFLRRAVELETVRVLCEAPDKGFVEELRAIIERQKDPAARADYESFATLDRDFHRRMYEAAGAPDLYALIRQRSGHIDRIRRLNLPVAGKMQQILRDHAQIAKAVAAGDVEQAQFRVRDHLSRSLAYTPELRDRHPAYFKS